VTRLFYLPLAVLSAAFVILCVHHGTAWPWTVVVHEDGRRTLLATIFYFDHVLGELPLDLLLSAAVAGAMLCAASPAPRPFGKLAAVCVVLDAAIIAGACILAGVKVATLYLFQFHTRDDEPMLYGSHWRYHLLSQAALMLLPLVFFKPKRNPVLLTAWATFAALTIVFGIGSASFIDPRYLGHETRELMTHALVTIPLAMWRTHSCVPRSHPCERHTRFNRNPALAFLAISTYLAAGVLLTGARHHTQSSDWTAVICAHFFEHTFSYLVVPAHAKLFYLLGARHA
jgi:hypothetical protein